MLYWLGYDSDKKFQYAWKNLSFIRFDRSICPQCAREIGTAQYREEPPYLLLEGGSVYPDYLYFGGAGKRPFVVSERTINLFEKSKVTGYTGYQQVTVEPDEGENHCGPCPNYYCLEVTGRVEFDFQAMRLKKKKVCPLCGQFQWNRQRFYPEFLDKDTWDGSDLCLLKSIPGFRVCSERVRELVQEHQLTGFSFREAK